MESESEQPEATVIKWCDCGCDCCSAKFDGSYSGAWVRSMKRKLDERDDDKLFIPGLLIPDVARVDIGNECVALREMVSSQQQTIQEMSDELDEERNAASSAANEAMSMILRLQREKAEVQMEARQFKRFSEEKMAHDQQEIMSMEDFLYKREQTIQALTCEVQAYKHRMFSYGLTESEVEGLNGGLTRSNSLGTNLENQYEFPAYNYPPLKCHLIENHVDPEFDNGTVDIEQYAFGESPHSLRDIEERINQLETSPNHSPVLEKVIVGHSPWLQDHSQKLSTDNAESFIATKEDFVSDSPDLKKVESASEFGDDMSDRIYTVDSIHNAASFDDDLKANRGVYDDLDSTRNDSSYRTDIGDIEVKKLYARLHALEADRESMKQALMSMRTDKAQLVLLKEIAQHLYKDMSPPSRMPVKKRSVFGNFTFFVLFKWIASFLFWRRRARQSKYMFGMSVNNVGLRMVLDKGPQMGQWRCLSRTQLLKY
ncbi:myosin-binding protein 7-like [Cynara cardunculus var. scolymus]|uniref:myosin-binding protein 7-like n=1 Tax=Cynara cardunculus var. scolymus TaxID=59895 RepID=UPI000D62CCD5|nr:myosin-binding protein 7-like [Cynara cardunculus var. scolymus]